MELVVALDVCPCFRKTTKITHQYMAPQYDGLSRVRSSSHIPATIPPFIHPSDQKQLIGATALLQRMKVKWRKTMHASLEGPGLSLWPPRSLFQLCC